MRMTISLGITLALLAQGCAAACKDWPDPKDQEQCLRDAKAAQEALTRAGAAMRENAERNRTVTCHSTSNGYNTYTTCR